MTRLLARALSALTFATLVSACGAPASPPRRHEGPDVVTAEWTSGDDAVLESDAGAAGTPR
ncbi:MAG: hypothetical protein U0234_22185 [Sandaracinus sp.]